MQRPKSDDVIFAGNGIKMKCLKAYYLNMRLLKSINIFAKTVIDRQKKNHLKLISISIWNSEACLAYYMGTETFRHYTDNLSAVICTQKTCRLL